MEKIKIAKYLASSGLCSRRKCEELIKSGAIKVNRTLAKVADRINPKQDTIEIGNKKIKPQEKVYYLLYKPVGYVTTTKDKHAQYLITDLAPKNPPVWPVGRLDKFTSGLIILTNDGELTQKLTHPKYEKEKEYSIITNKPLAQEEIIKIKKGVKLENGFIKPDLFEETSKNNYKMILHSGKKRIVRRIIENFGKKVSQLKRVRVDNLTLENLKIGQYRKLDQKKINNLLEK